MSIRKLSIVLTILLTGLPSASAKSDEIQRSIRIYLDGIEDVKQTSDEVQRVIEVFIGAKRLFTTKSVAGGNPRMSHSIRISSRLSSPIRFKVRSNAHEIGDEEKKRARPSNDGAYENGPRRAAQIMRDCEKNVQGDEVLAHAFDGYVADYGQAAKPQTEKTTIPLTEQGLEFSPIGECSLNWPPEEGLNKVDCGDGGVVLVRVVWLSR